MIDERFAAPRPQTVEALRRCPGDIVILGAGGKMGPSLALMARRAADQLGDGRRVIAVSRWSNTAVSDELRARGVEILAADLLGPEAMAMLPDAPNVVFMAGQKFGTSAAPHATWAMNVLVPARCAERYAGSRIVAFSTGNVYPLVPVDGPGASEATPVAPVGDYAWSCVGRERMFERSAAEHGTRVAIVRLNYAVELRYGVLVDIALRVRGGQPVPLAMGHVNVIWQEDANRVALECLAHATAPPWIVNVAGRARLEVREIAARFAAAFGTTVTFEGEEAPTALLSDSSRMAEIFGEPETSLETMIDRTAEWIRAGGALLDRPTHFEARDGRF